MAGKPRTNLRNAQRLRERAEDLLRDFDSTMPARCASGLAANAWQWSRMSLVEAIADLRLLEGALAERVPAETATQDDPNAQCIALGGGSPGDAPEGDTEAETAE